ncbi:hypothetical protein [Leifsonia poae]
MTNDQISPSRTASPAGGDLELPGRRASSGATSRRILCSWMR